jgi:hypothetical protein
LLKTEVHCPPYSANVASGRGSSSLTSRTAQLFAIKMAGLVAVFSAVSAARKRMRAGSDAEESKLLTRVIENALSSCESYNAISLKILKLFIILIIL